MSLATIAPALLIAFTVQAAYILGCMRRFRPVDITTVHAVDPGAVLSADWCDSIRDAVDHIATSTHE